MIEHGGPFDVSSLRAPGISCAAVTAMPTHALAMFAAEAGSRFKGPLLALQNGRSLVVGFVTTHFARPYRPSVLRLAGRLMLGGSSRAAPVEAIANSLNATLCDGGPSAPVALFCSSLDFETGDLTYVAAGQYALLVGQGGEVESLDAGGPPLGRDPGYAYFEETARLTHGDLLIAYNYHLSLDFPGERLVDIAREELLNGASAAAIRDRVAREWSCARRNWTGHSPASALFLTTSEGPRTLPGSDTRSVWKCAGKGNPRVTRPYRTLDLGFPRTAAAAAA